MITLQKGMTATEAEQLCLWSNQKGPRFHAQWLGESIDYPLVAEALMALETVYSIYYKDEFIGMIQQNSMVDENIHLGRFIINPQCTGQGYGKLALHEFIKECFNNPMVKSLTLHVLEHNIGAKKLYEKLGFTVIEFKEQPQRKYLMKKFR